VVRPELVTLAREVGNLSEADATMFARSVQRRQPPLSPKSQEAAVRALALTSLQVAHEAQWQQMREWIVARVQLHKAAAVHEADCTLIVHDTVWQRPELKLTEVLEAIAAATERQEWHGGFEQLPIEPLRAFLAEQQLTLQYTIEPPPVPVPGLDVHEQPSADDKPLRWFISFSW
jgi:hypothetical protein